MLQKPSLFHPRPCCSITVEMQIRTEVVSIFLALQTFGLSRCGGKRQKEPSSPIRIRRHQKQEISLSEEQSRTEKREERRRGSVVSVLSALTPTLQRAIHSQKCSRFNLFKADPIFSPSSGELERGVRGRKGSKMRYRGRLISLLSARQPKLAK